MAREIVEIKNIIPWYKRLFLLNSQIIIEALDKQAGLAGIDSTHSAYMQFETLSADARMLGLVKNKGRVPEYVQERGINPNDALVFAISGMATSLTLAYNEEVVLATRDRKDKQLVRRQEGKTPEDYLKLGNDMLKVVQEIARAAS